MWVVLISQSDFVQTTSLVFLINKSSKTIYTQIVLIGRLKLEYLSKQIIVLLEAV
jgi:hypothetical protein